MFTFNVLPEGGSTRQVFRGPEEDDNIVISTIEVEETSKPLGEGLQKQSRQRNRQAMLRGGDFEEDQNSIVN